MSIKDDEKYVKYLSEKVYFSSDIDEYEIRTFFDELAIRKREEPVEGGLQASMIVLPNKFAAKVNELDGNGLHLCEFVNLIKYLNNDHKYFSQKAMKYPTIYDEQSRIISEEAVEVCILDGEETLMIAISSFREINDYQKELLKKIILVCSEYFDNYQNIEIGINTPNVMVDYTYLNKDNYEDICSLIGNNNRIKR